MQTGHEVSVCVGAELMSTSYCLVNPDQEGGAR